MAEPLTDFEILQGALSLTIAIIGTIIGLIVILKYFQYKRKELLGVAFAIILVAVSWIASGFSFLSFIVSGVLLDERLYILLAYGFTLLSSLCMAYAIISLLYPKPAKKILLALVIVWVFFEVIFVIYLIISPEVLGTIGTEAGRFDIEAGRIPLLMVLIALGIAVVVRIVLVKEFWKSDNKKLQWRGRFILLELILLIIGVIMDAILSLTVPTLILARIIMVFRFIFVYFGWLLPDRLANWLIKEKE